MHKQLVFSIILVGIIGWCTYHIKDTEVPRDSSYSNREAALAAEVIPVAIPEEPYALFLRVFKHEDEIEAWVKAPDSVRFHLLTTFPVCRKSGTLGPKRKQGDLQVPEGVYSINRFNPNSNYHLSLGLNYPNASDQIRGNRNSLGGDIFIHGECVTVGCLPITNPLIEQLYELAEKAQREASIPVHIFPYRFDASYAQKVAKGSPHQNFWVELAPIYQFFEEHKRLPQVSINAEGMYGIK